MAFAQRKAANDRLIRDKETTPMSYEDLLNENHDWSIVNWTVELLN